MKLIVKISNDKPYIDYNSERVLLVTNDCKDINTLLNDDNLRMNNLEMLRYMVEDNFNESNEEESIKFIENLGHLNINDFNEQFIFFEKDIDPLVCKDFLEGINYQCYLELSSLSNENIIKLSEISFKYEPKVKSIYNSINFSDLSVMINTIKELDSIKDVILKYDLSTLERLMLLYDLIKERIYTEGDEKDAASSRDITNVMNGNNIVCVGYASIFTLVANSLGIESVLKQYVPKNKNDKVGHLSSVCYINDSKYNYHGCYEFDVTNNSKRNADDIYYIDNYSWFCLPEDFVKKVRDDVGLESNFYSFGLIDSFIKDYNEILESDSGRFLLKKQKELIIKKLKKYITDVGDMKAMGILNMIEAKAKEEDVSFDRLVNYLKEESKRIIKYDDFVKIFYRVRRVEHSIDPNKYFFNNDTMMRVTKNRFGDFASIMLWLGKEDLKIIHKEDYIKDINIKGNKIPYDLKRMELLHILNEMNNNKNDDNKGLTKH